MNRCHRRLDGVEPAPGVLRQWQTGDRRGQPHPLGGADKEGIHCHQIAGMPGFDVSLVELRAESFQEANLGIGERNVLLPHRLLEA